MSNDTDGLDDGRPQGSRDFSVRRWVVAGNRKKHYSLFFPPQLLICWYFY